MQNPNDTKDAKPHINITPLIDVLLVLLIIFMVISPLKPARFEAKIPSEPTQQDKMLNHNPHSLVVIINENLELKLNGIDDLGTAENAGKLSAKLTEIFQARKENGVFRENWQGAKDANDDGIERTVFIKAPRSINYGAVAKVIDGVKATGAHPIGLQIDDLAR